MRCRIVEKLNHERMPLERLLHDAALDADTAAVYEPHFAQTGGMGFGDVLFDDRRDIARREGMQIDHAFYRNGDRVLILHVPGRYVRRGLPRAGRTGRSLPF
jgi:hypothetical protein